LEFEVLNYYLYIVPRIGILHTICHAISVLGNRSEDAGLKNICIETGLVAEGPMNDVLSDKPYKQFKSSQTHLWSPDKIAMGTVHGVGGRKPWSRIIIHTFIDHLSKMTEDWNQQSFDKLLESPIFAKLMTQQANFLEHLRHDNEELSVLWMSYIDKMEKVVLDLVRATCEGKLSVYLGAIRSMLQWCFSYDKVNYVRYLSTYFAVTTILPEKKSDLYEAFKAGQV